MLKGSKSSWWNWVVKIKNLNLEAQKSWEQNLLLYNVLNLIYCNLYQTWIQKSTYTQIHLQWKNSTLWAYFQVNSHAFHLSSFLHFPSAILDFLLWPTSHVKNEDQDKASTLIIPLLFPSGFVLLSILRRFETYPDDDDVMKFAPSFSILQVALNDNNRKRLTKNVATSPRSSCWKTL